MLIMSSPRLMGASSGIVARRLRRRRARAGSALGAEGVPANPDVQASLLAALALAARAAAAPPLPPGAACAPVMRHVAMDRPVWACRRLMRWLPSLSMHCRSHHTRFWDQSMHELQCMFCFHLWRAHRWSLGCLMVIWRRLPIIIPVFVRHDTLREHGSFHRLCRTG